MPRFKLSALTKKLIRESLKEDLGKGDITSQAFVSSSSKSHAYIQAKADGVLAGTAVVAEVFRLARPKIHFRILQSDGTRVRKGQKIILISGSSRAILAAERTALNFLSHLSGIATSTAQFVAQTKGTKAKIYDTRKTTPLWRELEKQAVVAGGGYNHRMGLWDQVLIKDNHWANLSLGATHTATWQSLKSKIAKLKRRYFVELEVDDARSLICALPLKPHAVLLDNFSLTDMAKAVEITSAFRAPRPQLEASGGVSLASVRAIAKTGVDRISIGLLTHSAPALDFSLEIPSR